MTKGEAAARAMLKVISDRNRSVESAIAHGIEEGIALERERFRSILELTVPPGIEKAVITMALSGCSAAEAAALITIYENVSDADARARRKSIRIVRDDEREANSC